MTVARLHNRKELYFTLFVYLVIREGRIEIYLIRFVYLYSREGTNFERRREKGCESKERET